MAQTDISILLDLSARKDIKIQQLCQFTDIASTGSAAALSALKNDTSGRGSSILVDIATTDIKNMLDYAQTAKISCGPAGPVGSDATDA